MLSSAGVEVNHVFPLNVAHVEDVELVAHEQIECGSRISWIELRVDEVSMCAVKC